MTQPDQPDWPERQARVIGAEVRRHRSRLGLSAQQLADRCAELGLPISRSVIANTENNRRPAVTIAELLVLAAALEVPPVAVLFPIGYAETVEALPGRDMPPWEAATWFSGDWDPEGLPPRPRSSAVDFYRIHSSEVVYLNGVLGALREAEAVSAGAAARAAEAQEQAAEARRRIDAGTVRAKDADVAAVAEGEARAAAHALSIAAKTAFRAVARLRELREQMRALGLIPPTLPPHLAHVDNRNKAEPPGTEGAP